MYETFEKLAESRRQQILQVCIEEFAENGYKNASTNTMVSRLGISKGLLFLYFNSKRNLYLYIVEYLTKVMTQDYLWQFGSEPVVLDIFDNLGEFYKRTLRDKPEYLLFMLDAFLKTPDDIKEEVEERHSKAHTYAFQYLKGGSFRAGVEVELVVDLIHMISYRLGQMVFEEYKNIDISKSGKEGLENRIDYFAELFGKYMDILKFGVFEK